MALIFGERTWVRRGGLWVLAQNLLTLAALALGPLLRDPRWQRSTLPMGAVLFLVGAVFGIVGVRTLGRSRTPYPKPREDAPLVQDGIYAVVRHPLYTSLMFASIGWALAWSSWSALVAAAALAILLDAKARVEERWLRAKFPEYAAYARRVRRFIPMVY